MYSGRDASRVMSHMASPGLNGLFPMRSMRKAPPSIHSNDACPLAVSVGCGRNEVFDSPISYSPTNMSSGSSTGLCGLVSAMPMLPPVAAPSPVETANSRLIEQRLGVRLWGGTLLAREGFDE